MKTTPNTPARKLVKADTRRRVTRAVQAAIIRRISSYIDVMGDPRLSNRDYRITERKTPRGTTLHVHNEDIDIRFSINWKGGL